MPWHSFDPFGSAGVLPISWAYVRLMGGEGLTAARFFQYLLLEPSAENPGRSVILRYESGAPALVEAEVGRGRVLLLTTTVDREWTDLPIRPGFLPLIQEAARRLAGIPAGDSISALLIGAAREIPAAADDRRIEIIAAPSFGIIDKDVELQIRVDGQEPAGRRGHGLRAAARIVGRRVEPARRVVVARETGGHAPRLGRGGRPPDGPRRRPRVDAPLG